MRTRVMQDAQRVVAVSGMEGLRKYSIHKCQVQRQGAEIVLWPQR